MEVRAVPFSAKEIDFLRRDFEKLPEVSAFRDNPNLSARIAIYGIFREIGTVNDELARFIFDADFGKPVRLESLKAEPVQYGQLFGLRIFSEDTQRLELRTKGFYDVVHPTLSANGDGTLHSLFIFPEIIEKIARAEGVELVVVKSWGMNSIFGGFDPKQGYYQTNFWEIENNDALKFANLVRQGKIAFLGTHDLIAHIAGADRKHWPLLQENAQRVYEALIAYFNSAAKPSISALILPYTLGVVLDDLAQPPSYSSPHHIAVLNELLERIAKNEIPAGLPTLLTQFPGSFQKIIELSRESGIQERPHEIKNAISFMIREILGSSLAHPA